MWTWSSFTWTTFVKLFIFNLSGIHPLKKSFGRCTPLKESYHLIFSLDDVHPHKESYRLIFSWTMYIHLRNFIVLFFLLDDVHPLKESYHLIFSWTMYIHLRNFIVLFFSGRCLCFSGYVHSLGKRKITRIHGSPNNTFI